MFNAIVQSSQNSPKINNSVRLRGSAAAYLSKTWTASGNRKTWTLSFWLKRGDVTKTASGILGAGTSNTQFTYCYFNSNGQIIFFERVTLASGPHYVLTSVEAFRDPSAWYHIVLVYDTTQVTAADRVKMYVNNVQITFTPSSNGFPAQNFDGYFNSNIYLNNLGRTHLAGGEIDSNITRVCFVDGQALTPSSFAFTNKNTNKWDSKSVAQCKTIVNAGGANSYLLDFSNSSSVAALGYDVSSKVNNWTVNGVSLTAGVNYDLFYDTPTNNYATLNPIRDTIASANSSLTLLSDGNLKTVAQNATNGTVANNGRRSTILVSSGKWYVEFTCLAVQNSGTAYPFYGITNSVADSQFWRQAVTHFTTNDVIGLCLDASNGKVWWSKNGVIQGGDPVAGTTPTATLTGTDFSFYAIEFGWTGGGFPISSSVANFGQRPFAYTPPTGYKALCTANLPATQIRRPNKHFDTKLWVSNGGIQNINGIQFQPDILWHKNRGIADGNAIVDSVRGVSKYLITHNTNVEGTDANFVTSFNSDGWSMGSTSYVNASNMVTWLWKVGGTSISNNDGSITSQISVNQTAGISIATYTAPASGSFSVGHGLGVAPAMIISKTRGGTGNWGVWHKSFSTQTDSYMNLNTTQVGGTIAGIWGAGHTSSVTGGLVGQSDSANTTSVRYCFAEIPGFSKFGYYTGNGSVDGPFVWCGFKPRWLLLKDTTTAQNWFIIDTSRDTNNLMVNYLNSNLSNIEAAFGSGGFDFVASGFKVRTSSIAVNTNASKIIFMAFADVPFKHANAR